MAPSARRVDRAGDGAAQDPVGAWLADGAEPVPVDTLLAYTPADVADAERYCLALYHQLDIVSERPADAIAALWARSAQLDPERRLMKAAFDLSLLDVCYETLRHAGVFGRWIRPRPKLALLIARSRCLQTYYGESERRAQTTRFSTPMQYVKDLVRNLLLMLFLFVTIGKPQGLVPTQITLPYFGRAVLQAALIAIVTSAVVIVLRRALHLPRSPTVSVADQHTAQALKAGPVSFLMRSIVYDLLDEIIRRWMGVFSLGS